MHGTSHLRCGRLLSEWESSILSANAWHDLSIFGNLLGYRQLPQKERLYVGMLQRCTILEHATRRLDLDARLALHRHELSKVFCIRRIHRTSNP